MPRKPLSKIDTCFSVKTGALLDKKVTGATAVPQVVSLPIPTVTIQLGWTGIYLLLCLGAFSSGLGLSLAFGWSSNRLFAGLGFGLVIGRIGIACAPFRGRRFLEIRTNDLLLDIYELAWEYHVQPVFRDRNRAIPLVLVTHEL